MRAVRRRLLATALVGAAVVGAVPVSATGVRLGAAVPQALAGSGPAAPGGVPVPAGLPRQTGLQVVVLPHPDDEIEAWSQVADRPRTYTVFLLLTRGERSTHCRTPTSRLVSLAADGVRVPRPVPDDLSPAGCGRARIDAWEDFLDRAAMLDPTLATGPLRTSALPGGGVVETGARGARVELDLGDGQLTADAVRQAVRRSLALVGTTLPALPVERLVGAAYYADAALAGPGGDPRSPCPVCDPSATDSQYRHPDHAAVDEALRTTWFGVPAVVATGPDDPAVRLRSALPASTYAALMRSAGVRREGLFQREYGWLHAGRGWPAGQVADGPSFMTQEQAFATVTSASDAEPDPAGPPSPTPDTPRADTPEGRSLVSRCGHSWPNSSNKTPEIAPRACR